METAGNYSYSERRIASAPESNALIQHRYRQKQLRAAQLILCGEVQKQHQGRRNLLKLTETTHSGASWPGSRRPRRPSSACGRRCGRNGGRSCGSWYASYRTKLFPSSARHKTIKKRKQGKKQSKTKQDRRTTKQHNKEHRQRQNAPTKHPTSQQTSTTDTRTETQDRREDEQNETDGQTDKPTENNKADAVSIVCASGKRDEQLSGFAKVFAATPPDYLYLSIPAIRPAWHTVACVGLPSVYTWERSSTDRSSRSSTSRSKLAVTICCARSVQYRFDPENVLYIMQSIQLSPGNMSQVLSDQESIRLR